MPAEWKGAVRANIDVATHDDPPVVGTIDGDEILLKPFDVSVISIK